MQAAGRYTRLAVPRDDLTHTIRQQIPNWIYRAEQSAGADTSAAISYAHEELQSTRRLLSWRERRTAH